MMMQNYLPSLHDFSDRVQGLRRESYNSFGWDYRASITAPSLSMPLVACGMIFSRSGRFDCYGDLKGRAFDNQDFELTDISAPIIEPSQYSDDCPRTPEWHGFQGVILSLAHRRSFSGRTIIRGDRGKLNPPSIEGMKRVGLVDRRFEKRFEVYSEDQVEARALITPDFMERLSAFEGEYLGRNVQCAFIGHKLHVVLEIDDRFSFTRERAAFNFDDACRVIVQETAAVFDLLERVQTLDAAIGARGVDGADQARKAYYGQILQQVVAKLKSLEKRWKNPHEIPEELRHTHYLFCDSLRGLLGPRF